MEGLAGEQIEEEQLAEAAEVQVGGWGGWRSGRQGCRGAQVGGEWRATPLWWAPVGSGSVACCAVLRSAHPYLAFLTRRSVCLQEAPAPAEELLPAEEPAEPESAEGALGGCGCAAHGCG